MTDRSKTLILLNVAVFLAGWTGILGRLISLAGLPLVWYRMMISVATMSVVVAVTGKIHRTSFGSVLRIAACGILLSLHWVAFYASIKASNVSVGVATIATGCFFTTIFDPLINRKKFSSKEVLISFIAIAGILLIFSLDVRYRLGIALGLVSAALYSLFSIFNVRVAESTGEDSATMLLYELLGGVVLLSLLMSFYCVGNTIAPQGNDVLMLLILGTVFTVAPFLFQIIALRTLAAFTVNVTYNLEPVYSIIFAAVIFGETSEVGLSFWLGLALIVLSVTMQTLRAKSGR